MRLNNKTRTSKRRAVAPSVLPPPPWNIFLLRLPPLSQKRERRRRGAQVRRSSASGDRASPQRWLSRLNKDGNEYRSGRQDRRSQTAVHSDSGLTGGGGKKIARIFATHFRKNGITTDVDTARTRSDGCIIYRGGRIITAKENKRSNNARRNCLQKGHFRDGGNEKLRATGHCLKIGRRQRRSNSPWRCRQHFPDWILLARIVVVRDL